jgi:hypothetical protein
MPPDAGLVARVADALATLGERGARQKNVFGGRGFLLGKSTFVIVFGDALIVKTARDDYAAALAAPASPPSPRRRAPDGQLGGVSPATRSPDDPELDMTGCGAGWGVRG